jgi:hypothetical protein
MSRLLGVFALAAASCAGGAPAGHPGDGDDAVDAGAIPGDAPGPSSPDAGGSPIPMAKYPRDCPTLFRQDRFPTFEIEIDPAEWEALKDELASWRERQEAGLPLKPYHPLIAFRHEGDVITDAMIRLRGNPAGSWNRTEKMQFQISFNENDKRGRYRGLRKIVLDGPRYNRSYLRDRVAYAILRDVGLPASCANNARLVVNGEYYGLYTNVEKVDREFLERNFPDPDGDLYKGGRELKTNEETSDGHRALLFWATQDVAALAELVDLEQAVGEWAAEAMLPHADGYWAAGGENFYLYDDPRRGRLVFIPWDLDAAFEVLPADTDPRTHRKSLDTKRPQLEAVLGSPSWLARFVDAIEAGLEHYDEDSVVARVDTWSAQIREAALADPTRPFTFESHLQSIKNLRDYVGPRTAFLRQWIACQRGGPCP